jgi:hypothetical protein
MISELIGWQTTVLFSAFSFTLRILPLKLRSDEAFRERAIFEQRRDTVAAVRAIADHLASELGKTAMGERSPEGNPQATAVPASRRRRMSQTHSAENTTVASLPKMIEFRALDENMRASLCSSNRSAKEEVRHVEWHEYRSP